MRIQNSSHFSAQVLLLLPLLALALAPDLLIGDPTSKDRPDSPGQSTNGLGPIPISIFVVPRTRAEGRDPFFPRSAPVAPVVVPKPSEPPPLDISGLVLNGITGPPRRTAMINGRTFEKGEEEEIRLPSGERFLIKCEDIGDESVKVLINGNLQKELKLRSSF